MSSRPAAATPTAAPARSISLGIRSATLVAPFFPRVGSDGSASPSLPADWGMAENARFTAGTDCLFLEPRRSRFPFAPPWPFRDPRPPNLEEAPAISAAGPTPIPFVRVFIRSPFVPPALPVRPPDRVRERRRGAAWRRRPGPRAGLRLRSPEPLGGDAPRSDGSDPSRVDPGAGAAIAGPGASGRLPARTLPSGLG